MFGVGGLSERQRGLTLGVSDDKIQIAVVVDVSGGPAVAQFEHPSVESGLVATGRRYPAVDARYTSENASEVAGENRSNPVGKHRPQPRRTM